MRLKFAFVHKDIAETFLPETGAEIFKDRVEIRGMMTVCKIINAVPAAAGFLILNFGLYNGSCFTVDNLEDAERHIALHSTPPQRLHCNRGYGGSGALHRACRFRRRFVVNASTRFTDGGEFGLAAKWEYPPKSCTQEDLWELCELNT